MAWPRASDDGRRPSRDGHDGLPPHGRDGRRPPRDGHGRRSGSRPHGHDGSRPWRYGPHARRTRRREQFRRRVVPEDRRLGRMESAAGPPSVASSFFFGLSHSDCAPSAVAAAAQMLARAVATRSHLLAVNRFGRLESEGGGTRAEIGQALIEDIPLIVCVPRRYLDAWNAFAEGLDGQIPPLRAAIEHWWMSLETSLNAAI